MDKPLFWLQFGNKFVKEGKIHAAMDYFRQGLRINPSSTDLIYCLASCYTKLGMNKNAILWLQHGITLKPKWVEGCMALTCTYF